MAKDTVKKKSAEESLADFMKWVEENVSQNELIHKDEILEYLQKEESAVAEAVISLAVDDENGKKITEKFWSYGEEFETPEGILLSRAKERDKEEYIALQKECGIFKSMLKSPEYCDMLWEESAGQKALRCTIRVDGEYIGHCGINNVTREKWELSIELLQKWHNQGIGTAAIRSLMEEIDKRTGVSEFRVRIDPINVSSQKLFEKLGAEPNGVAELLLHKEEDKLQCEEENLHLLDENIRVLADRFGVEPRKLLSHVLEYKLARDRR